MINMPAGPEIMVILLLALLVLGPDQLPKAMRSFGNVMSEIRKVSSSFQEEMREALEVMEDGVTPSEGSLAVDDGSGDAHETKKSGGAERTEPAGTDHRNGSPGDRTTAAGSADNGDGSSADTGSTRPPIDPADRAAG